jgi:hypothetical protein
MKQIKITEIEVTPEVAAALCPYDSHCKECYTQGMQMCKHCPISNPKSGDLILLRVGRGERSKQSEVMIGS